MSTNDEEFKKITNKLSEDDRFTKAKTSVLTVVGFIGFVCTLPIVVVVWTWAIRYVANG